MLKLDENIALLNTKTQMVKRLGTFSIYKFILIICLSIILTLVSSLAQDLSGSIICDRVLPVNAGFPLKLLQISYSNVVENNCFDAVYMIKYEFNVFNAIGNIFIYGGLILMELNLLLLIKQILAKYKKQSLTIFFNSIVISISTYCYFLFVIINLYGTGVFAGRDFTPQERMNLSQNFLWIIVVCFFFVYLVSLLIPKAHKILNRTKA